MRKTFSFPLFIIKGGFTLLALYITAVFLMTNLPLIGQRYFTWFIWIAGVSGTLVLIGLAHETRLTSRFIAIFVKGLPPRWLRIIMDLLDRYTNKDGLLARLAAVQRSEHLDATALAAAVKQKVVGQDLVADEVAATLRRRLAQVARDKPVGVFLFVGPPGVGKTEMGKQFAHHLERGFVFEDMSTCSNPAGAERLFGVPPGYSGSDRYGTLTGGLRDQPNSFVLLDEIEKAHVDVQKRFLTAWNDGFVTEASTGQKVPTNRAIFAATTNAAADRIGELAREITDRDKLLAAVHNVLKEAGFPGEVLSRIDEVFVFNPLEGLDLARVAIIQIVSIVTSYGLELDEGGIDDVILFEAMQRAEVLQTAGGVRAVIRALEKRIADVLIEARQKGARRVKLIMNESDLDQVRVTITG
ncbi:ATP-dependent Clp protease ATP-binding subunit [Microvirga sp. BT688]|uniref:AAA family ATPase n=1 Tax=Microvirga sp. TaxID=1873136 RepID=UPI001684E87D|nr:AAA family ATPase [Microvirga sp.]MBD2745931.1 ATP-dependent Clp protease ATP-binding subunit [Microvirga sp.]